MDTYTFIVEILKAVSWPIVVFGCVLLLKSPISNLLPFIQKLKYKELEVNFSKKAEELEKTLDKELPRETEQLLVTPKVIKLAELSPRAAILEAWVEVEFTAKDVLMRNSKGLVPPEESRPHNIIKSLYSKQLVSKEILNMFNGLKILRNQALHENDHGILNTEAAINYADMCSRLTNKLNEL